MKPQTTTNDVMSARSSFVIMCSSTVLSPIGSSDLGESMVSGMQAPAGARQENEGLHDECCSSTCGVDR